MEEEGEAGEKKEESGPQKPQTGDPALQEKIKAMLTGFRDVVPEDPEAKPPYPPVRSIDHEIETIPGMEPPNKPAFRMSPAELAELQKQLTDL